MKNFTKRSFIILILLILTIIFALVDHASHGRVMSLLVLKINASYVMAMPYNNRAADYLDNGKYDEAIPEAKKAIEIYPRYAKAYTNLANAYYEKGLYDQALETVEKALKINPDLYEALNTIGIIFNETGRLEEAINAHQKTIKVSPNSKPAHQNLALDYFDKDLFDMAEKEFDKVRRIEAGSTSILKNNGWNKQIEVFRDILKKDPYNARVNYLLGEVYYKIGLYDLSIVSFQKSIKVSSKYNGSDYNVVSAYNNLAASYLQEGRFNEAISNYKKAIQINPKSYTLHYGLGIAYWRKNLYNEAIKSCQQVLQIKPDFIAARYIIGVSYEQMKDYSCAVNEYKKIYEADGLISQCVFLSLARCYLNIGMKDKALKELDNFKKYTSNLDEIHTGFLWIFAHAQPVSAQIDGRAYTGEEEVKKAYKTKFPQILKTAEIRNESDRYEHAQELFNAGNLYLVFGLNDEAMELLKRSRYFGYNYASKIYFSIGTAYLQKGLLLKAVNEFYKAIRMDYVNFFDEMYGYLLIEE